MTTHAAHASTGAQSHDPMHNDMSHVASKKALLGVFFSLMILTALTVGAPKLGLGGSVDLWIAMIIATIKATLVGLYFMHLRYDKPFNTIIFLSAFVFVGIFLGFTMMDSDQYQNDIVWEQKLDLSGFTPAEH